MKVKLREIVDAMPALTQFAMKELPAKAAYRVSKLVRKMNAEHNAFNEARNGLIKRFGKEVPGKPGQYALDLAGSEKAKAELEALLETEVELAGCARVEWASIEGLHLAPAVLADLEAFIEAPPA